MSTFSQNVKKVARTLRILRSAIVRKGVAVPDDARLSDMPALVMKIGGEEFAKMTSVRFDVTGADGTVASEVVTDGEVSLASKFKSNTAMSIVITEDWPDDYSGVVSYGTDADYMFYQCAGITTLAVPAGLGARIQYGAWMFGSCTGLTALELPDGFGACLLSAPHIFTNMSSLTSLRLPPGFGKELITADSTFAGFGGSGLGVPLELPAGFCAKATSAIELFKYSVLPFGLRVNADFGGNIIYASKMFNSVGRLPSLDLPAGCCSKATSMPSCFRSLKEIQSITLRDGFGAMCTACSYMFSDCPSLSSITLPVGFCAKASAVSNMFYLCSALEHIVPLDPDLEIGEDGANGVLCVPVSFSLSDSPLDADSVAVVIKSLPAVESAQTLTLSSTAYAHVTDALRGVANTKNWTVASA